MKIHHILIILIVIVHTTLSTAQTDDNIIWASIKVQKNIDQKTTIAVAPIFRFNEDISNYQNSSIDISAKRKLNKSWSFQILARTWFVPNSKKRQFLWFDLGYNKKFEKFNIGSSLRMHYALDVYDNPDADFIRWKTTFSVLKLGKIKPFIAIEPWLRLNKANNIQRFRIEPGFKYKFNEQIDLLTMYRREASVNLDPEINVNMYVITLSYTFK